MSLLQMPAPSVDPAVNLAAYQALRAQLVADGGGRIVFGVGCYDIARIGGDGPNKMYCLELPPERFEIIGQGRGATVLRPASGSPTWTRLVGTNLSFDGRVAHLTVDGNAENIQAHEQNHGVFLSQTRRVVLDDLDVRNTQGDGIYWHVEAIGNVVRDCHLAGCGRVGIHAQAFRDCEIVNCHITQTAPTQQGGVKAEQDDPGIVHDGLSVRGGSFDGSGDHFGVLVSGYNDQSKASNITVEGARFRGLGQAIGLGVWSTHWLVAGNQIIGCRAGVTETNYALAYGYEAHQDVAIVGNTVSDAQDNAEEQVAISLTNTRGATVFANVVSGMMRGLRVRHSHAVHLGRNVVRLSGQNAVGLSLYRSQQVTSMGDVVNLNGGGPWSIGVHVSDDGTYTGLPCAIGELTVHGPAQYGIYRDMVAAGVDVRNLTTHGVVVPIR